VSLLLLPLLLPLLLLLLLLLPLLLPLLLLLLLQVFGCKGTAPTSAIIAAIQQAVLDGMDIINLSLSLGPGFPEVKCLSYRDIARFLIRQLSGYDTMLHT
jgi:hypothetical protein